MIAIRFILSREKLNVNEIAINHAIIHQKYNKDLLY